MAYANRLSDPPDSHPGDILADVFDFMDPAHAASPIIQGHGKFYTSAAGWPGTGYFLYGTAGNDVLRGSNGAETIIGGAGNDTLDGGTDQTADTLYGDNLHPAFTPHVGKKSPVGGQYVYGNDWLNFGMKDTAKSAEGWDVYDGHGGHYSGPALLHFDLGMLGGHDKLLVAGTPKVVGYEIDAKAIVKGQPVLTLKSVTIKMTDDNPITTGQWVKVKLDDDGHGVWQPVKLAYEGGAGSTKPAVVDFIEDGFSPGLQDHDANGIPQWGWMS